MAPNVLWIADLTYLRGWEGWLYLAAVQDAYSRMIVGWGMAEHMRAQLVVDALQMAIARRRPDPGIAVSMGSRSDCFDNAESFFATLNKELAHRRAWPTRRELAGEVFEYIEALYIAAAGTPRWVTSHPSTTSWPPTHQISHDQRCR